MVGVFSGPFVDFDVGGEPVKVAFACAVEVVADLECAGSQCSKNLEKSIKKKVNFLRIQSFNPSPTLFSKRPLNEYK